MKRSNNVDESWKRIVPDGMFLSTYRAYLADLEFLCEQTQNRRPRPKSQGTESVSPRVLKTKAAASYLGISTWKLRNLVQSGEIRYIPGDATSPWLFDKQELDQWIETRKQRL
jgi:excisionase family DNA binding protein